LTQSPPPIGGGGVPTDQATIRPRPACAAADPSPACRPGAVRALVHRGARHDGRFEPHPSERRNWRSSRRIRTWTVAPAPSLA